MKPETAKFLDKADRSIRATSLLIDGGEADSAVSRGYYAMLQVACARPGTTGWMLRSTSTMPSVSWNAPSISGTRLVP